MLPWSHSLSCCAANPWTPTRQLEHTLWISSCTRTSNAEEASAGQVLEFLPLWPIQIVCNQQCPIHAAH